MIETNEAVKNDWAYVIELDECIKCASCSSIAPEVFLVDDSGAHILRQPANEQEVHQCEAAVINCPTDAIKRIPL